MFTQKDIDKISGIFSKINKKKYWIIIPGFLAFILYFGEHSLYKQQVPKQHLKELKNEAELYKQQIIENTEKLSDLRTNNENIERFAREEYFMKKKNEDIYVVVASDSVK